MNNLSVSVNALVDTVNGPMNTTRPVTVSDPNGCALQVPAMQSFNLVLDVASGSIIEVNERANYKLFSGYVKQYEVYVSGGRHNGTIITPSETSNEAVLELTDIDVFELVTVSVIAVSQYDERQELLDRAFLGMPATSDVIKRGIHVRTALQSLSSSYCL